MQSQGSKFKDRKANIKSLASGSSNFSDEEDVEIDSGEEDELLRNSLREMPSQFLKSLKKQSDRAGESFKASIRKLFHAQRKEGH